MPERYGIELDDLRGAIKDGKKNIAMRLQDHLQLDKASRRFSVVSFDGDVADNVRAIEAQVRQDNIVGMVYVHQPDFELANFSLGELAEVAARIDETHGYSGEGVRNADWTDVKSGGDFQSKYKKVSARKPGSLKGEAWGRALARYALAHPRRADDKTMRPIVIQVEDALRARHSNYDFDKENFRFDPTTFKKVPRQVPAP